VRCVGARTASLRVHLGHRCVRGPLERSRSRLLEPVHHNLHLLRLRGRRHTRHLRERVTVATRLTRTRGLDNAQERRCRPIGPSMSMSSTGSLCPIQVPRRGFPHPRCSVFAVFHDHDGFPSVHAVRHLSAGHARGVRSLDWLAAAAARERRTTDSSDGRGRGRLTPPPLRSRRLGWLAPATCAMTLAPRWVLGRLPRSRTTTRPFAHDCRPGLTGVPIEADALQEDGDDRRDLYDATAVQDDPREGFTPMEQADDG